MLLQENIIVAKEIDHTMSKMVGKKGFMVIKIDLEKAYDRMSWEFLIRVLEEIGIQENLIHLISCCMKSTSFQLLWNGNKSESFVPSRGIRQGDPISPYLFVLGMEKLSHIIADAVDSKRWRPIRLGRGGTPISHLLFADDLMLYCEAEEDQMKVVMECLGMFAEMSGQKVNTGKTTICFSKNVEKQKRKKLIEIGGFKESEEVGRYLGAQIVRGRKNNAKFQPLLDKIQRRLSGWKRKTLSLAGRLTLVQAVTQQIPVYQMCHEDIPKGVCRKIEKMQRDFIWGSEEGKRKFHNVGWKKMCRTKEEGGYGLKDIKKMNDAMLSKVGWEVIAKPQKLVSQVLKTKYERRVCLRETIQVKPGDSGVWKRLGKIWPAITENTGWEIGNGETTGFFKDRWANKGMRIMDICAVQVNEELMARKVGSFVDQNGNWNLEEINDVLPNEMLTHIKSLLPPEANGEDDRIKWMSEANGLFTVASMYKHLRNEDRRGEEKVWKLVWDWKGPKRIQVFMWLAAGGNLFTSMRRGKILNTSPICLRCNMCDEDVLHALRDCRMVRDVWEKLLPLCMWEQFFRLPLKEWFEFNLLTMKRKYRKDWDLYFAVAVWYLWSWRNRILFETEFQWPREAEDIIKKYVEEVREAWNGERKILDSINVQVAWQKPKSGWIKMNCDGAVRENNGEGGCGGLFRNEKGEWLGGFMRKAGICSPIEAELWAVWTGLQHLHNLESGNLIVEVDSSVLAEQLEECLNGRDAHCRLLSEIKNLLLRQGNIVISQVYREGNVCADWLARQSFIQSNQNLWIKDPPGGIIELLNRDAVGMLYPRAVGL